MRRWRRWSDLPADAEVGSASLEFLAAGLILLVPLVYLVLALAAVQGGALAVEGAARQAARVYVSSPDERQATARVLRAVGVALADHHLDPDGSSVRIECGGRSAGCLVRRGTVTVTVRVIVPLPLMPGVLSAEGRSGVPLQASATQTVSRFWGGG